MINENGFKKVKKAMIKESTARSIRKKIVNSMSKKQIVNAIKKIHQSDEQVFEKSLDHLTLMQQFVVRFLRKRKSEKLELMTFNISSERFKNIRSFICCKFPYSVSMKKSESMDFMLYLLEGLLNKEYGDLEKFKKDNNLN